MVVCDETQYGQRQLRIEGGEHGEQSQHDERHEETAQMGMAQVPVQEGALVIPVADGVAHGDAHEERIVDGGVCLGAYQQEDTDDEQRAEDERTQGDITEVLKPCIEPFDPEQVGDELAEADRYQHAIVLQPRREPYRDGEDSGNEQRAAEVQRKQVCERLAKGLRVVFVLGNLADANACQTHHREEDAVVHQVVDGVDASDVLDA